MFVAIMRAGLDIRYQAHARRIDLLRQHSPPPLADYWSGYRLGMVRAMGDTGSADERGRDALAVSALRGDEQDITRMARGCGYHDGQWWGDPSLHRGLLRLAIRTAGDGSARRFSLRWKVDEASVRQMLAGTRPVPANRHAELLDWIDSAVSEVGIATPSDDD